MTVTVEHELFGDARPTEREFPTVNSATKFINTIFRDGGTARIVWVVR